MKAVDRIDDTIQLRRQEQATWQSVTVPGKVRQNDELEKIWMRPTIEDMGWKKNDQLSLVQVQSKTSKEIGVEEKEEGEEEEEEKKKKKKKKLIVRSKAN